MAKISKSTASKSYNQKTIAKINARDAARGGSSSGGDTIESLTKQLSDVSAQAKAKGIDTSVAQRMVDQTKAQGSTPFKGSAWDISGVQASPMVAETMYTQSKINLPEEKDTTDYGTMFSSGNAGLASTMADSYTYSPKTGFTKVEQPKDTFTSLFEQAQQANADAFGEMDTGEERLRRLERETQLKQKQQAVADTTAQLNEIIAKQQADILRVQGTGRGIPEAIIGGQQAQINKEAAIAALPLQAKLAADQGALELAQDYVTKMYEIQSIDALMKYNYKSKVIDTVYQFATQTEQRKLDAIKDKENKAFEMQKMDIQYQRDLANTALEYGQSGLATSILKLNPKSADFSSQLATLQGRLSKPVGTTKRDTQVVDGKLIDMQTGEVISTLAAGEGAQQQINDTLSLARELLSGETAGKSGSVGFGFQKFVPFGLSLGLQGDRASFENKVNTLKANLTLENLSLLKGPMSDKDLAFLQAIGSSLTTNMSEVEFDKQLKKVISKLETKASTPSMSGGNIIVAPDGLEIQIID